ncbi:MAG TPA: DUF5696 domain-containing protein [Acidobacteriaceae bacterium]|nr:DUF5696 domain-containing protein [Acidobacteriaceae bacterium]
MHIDPNPEQVIPTSAQARMRSAAPSWEGRRRSVMIAGLMLLISLYGRSTERLYASAGNYRWMPPAQGSLNSLGTIVFVGKGAGIQLLAPSIHARAGVLRCASAAWDGTGRLQLTYSLGAVSVHVTVAVVEAASGLRATVDADVPVIQFVDAGPWSPGLQVQPVTIPYYTGNVVYAPGTGMFLSAWWDWHATRATALNGTAAQYSPRTDSTLNAVHEVLWVAGSPDVDAVLPSPGNPPSPYIGELSGRLVLDIWTRDFKQIQQGLAELGDYGITGCAAIIHVWQHAGYDNALPQHTPANDEEGGDAGLLAAVNAGKADGCLVALHENYVDYYPNYPKFDPAAVALNSDGSRMLSWLNQAGVRAYSTKPAWMVKNAATQSPEIHDRYGTTASYIDVNSGIWPSSHGDMDAHAPGAGTLGAWLAGDAGLWSFERRAHDGPVFGEGRYHWFYSGLLDGVEAQFGTGGVLDQPGPRAPLFVDFDLREIHPLEVNHGMGYYQRWLASGEMLSQQAMDAYRMQEVAFGHAPFVGQRYWNDIPHVLVESNLVAPVAGRYGAAAVSSIEYQVNGEWTTPSEAAQAAVFSRVQVTYNNGLTVVANALPTSLIWQGIDLPQYGWVAKAPGLLAYTAVCGDVICDYAETSTSIFANSRNQTDARNDMGYAAPTLLSIKQGKGRSVFLTCQWKIDKTINDRYKPFLHFVNEGKPEESGEIAFQGNLAVGGSLSARNPGQSVMQGPVEIRIPPAVPDGSYSIRIGLYDPRTNDRLPLEGMDDGTQRYILGSLTISGGGAHVEFHAAPLSDPRMNPRGSVVNFATVQTDGMLSIRRESGQWVLRPFPRTRSFTILLQSARFPMPVNIKANGGSTSLVRPTSAGTYWKLPLTGAKSYSWAASGN